MPNGGGSGNKKKYPTDYKIREIPVEYRIVGGKSKLHLVRNWLKMFFGIIAVAWNDSD